MLLAQKLMHSFIKELGELSCLGIDWFNNSRVRYWERGVTSTQTTSTFGNIATGTYKWAGGVLAPNGKIYGIPYSSSTILEIDPETRTTSTFGSVGTGTYKWLGGVLASNGKIFGIPCDSTSILEIDSGEILSNEVEQPPPWACSPYVNKF